MDNNKFSYQAIAATQVLENLYSGKYIASILGAIPNSGKTQISFEVINRYIQKNPKAQVVVLTHGQNILKTQYLDDLKNPHTKVSFTFGSFLDEAQVLVGIPQSLNKLKVSKIDLLIIDEAHQYYLAKTVQSIIVDRKIKHVILLTGSVAQFNLHNQTCESKYGMTYISGSELQSLGIFSAVDMDIVVTSSSSVRDQIGLAMKKIDLKGANRSKIMFAVKNINDAKIAKGYLEATGRKVSMSTSENDSDNVEIKNFKEGRTNTLVVVSKGILGFSDPNITCLVDLRESKDLECAFQLMARILRVHPQGIDKTYIRMCRVHNEGVIFLNKLLALFDKEVYVNFNGSNMTVEIE